MGALTGLRVLDLSRVLAGPTATQVLGDLGADIIKIERPGVGDDTRTWGPPFLKDDAGNDTTESAYYLCANRNKRSVAVDLSTPAGQDIIKALIPHCDVLIENFKVGSLAKYGLSYDQLKAPHPRLIYCSITGFGQTGPLASEPGYDFLAQGMSGFMNVTGPIDGPPSKAGVAISDYVTGLYAVVGILAALRARDQTGAGQHVDIGLLDCSIAMMSNVAQYYLTAGHPPQRIGNAHATIVPYQEFESADGHVIIAVGNDHQFRILATALDHPEWADDPRFIHNTARVAHRTALIDQIKPVMKTRTTADWVDTLRKLDVPVGPLLSIDQTFKEPQVIARETEIKMHHPATTTPISLVGSALKLSGTPVEYHRAPPTVGADTVAVLTEVLNMSTAQIDTLRAKNIIGTGP